ncbi:MAG: enterochelin esterase domain-containing protein, partial [Candidatus Hydrogenedentota bacterium]
MKILNMTCLSILMLTVFSEILPNSSQAEEASDIRSPRLRALAAELERGDRKALDKFWRDMEHETTPLIETIEDDPTHVLVSVVWRGDKDTKNVLLVGTLARGHSLESTFERLGKSDLWYITYWTRRDLRATYQISPNDAMIDVPMNDAVAVAKQRKNYRRDPFNPNKYGGSLVELPDAPAQPWIENNPDAPRGELETQKKFSSAILGNECRISVYLPPNYDPSAEAYPTCLFFDLSIYTTVVPTPRILNNLIHAKKIPPVVAVFVGNAKGMRNDELPC